MSLIALIFLPLLLLALLIQGGVEGVVWIRNQRDSRREAKRAQIEAELDRTQGELRATLLLLAAEMNNDAHEARKALIQASLDAANQRGKSSD